MEKGSVIMQNGRIYGDEKNIDATAVKKFFANRTQKNVKYRLNVTNLQDSNPEVAIMRNQEEVDKIVPLLNFKPDSCILDIGCGVGRWADNSLGYLSEAGKYVGTDFCENVLDLARKNFKQDSRCEFYVSDIQGILNNLPKSLCTNKFDIIIICGVLMYVNDGEVEACLNNVSQLLSEEGQIFIREPIALEERLTLDKFYSQECKDEYSAIYRTKSFYEDKFKAAFLDNGIKCKSEGFLYDEGKLNNRKETQVYYWVFEK